MDGVFQRVISILIAVVIFFILPVYIAYEKKDDISYALALKMTTDFVENVNSKGYITSDMYAEYLSKLAVTQNSYDIYMEHTAKKYNPVIYSYTDDLKTIRAKFDYNLYKDQYDAGQIVISEGKNAGTYNNLVLAYDLSEKKYTETQILSVISSMDKRVTTKTNLAEYQNIDYATLPAISSIYELDTPSNTNIYTMNKGDEFSVIIKNQNTTMATILYNAITMGVAGNNNTRIYVNYGGTVKAEAYRDKFIDDDIQNYNPEGDNSQTATLVNSYITNGLVVLLDGEYNNATVHSNSSPIWDDISGAGNNGALAEFDFNDESGWIYNGLHFTGKEYVSLKEFDLDEMTIEVVVKFDSVTDVDNPQQSVLSNINNGGVGLVFNQLNSAVANKKGKVSFDVYTTDDEGNIVASSVVGNNIIQANKIYSISGSLGKIELSTDESGMAFETFAQLLGVNGEVEGKDFNLSYTKPATGSNFVLGGTPLVGAGANTQFKGTIYSVRIYDRALTEEEIKENYEVDKVKYKIE
ncbi:MAG: hypothetical protein J6A15_04925 [Clostridia bacterium]|nr:hypothetical protein [Clostridia bacterium]